MSTETSGADDAVVGRQSATAVFLAFLRLGFTAFGGPVAHLGYFRDDFVARRRWLDERSYADLVALCQFLPGPASSQVGIGIGLAKAGLPGAFAAWFAFTMPSALMLAAFGYGVVALGDDLPTGVLQGLKVVAVAVVAHALWGMAKTLCPDRPRATLAVASAVALTLSPTVGTQMLVLVAGAVAGLLLFKPEAVEDAPSLDIRISRPLAWLSLFVFFAGLFALPVAASVWPSQTLALIDSFYRSGSLVFGGGHVVLPLLQAEVVPTGWVERDAFLAGYGAAQAVPGPLFTYAAFLGAVMTTPPSGALGALICLLAIFAPSFALVFGVLPFWDSLRQRPRVRCALNGVNAVVVGILLAALYDPVWTAGILDASTFALGLAAWILIALWRAPPWLVVIAAGIVGGLVL